MKLNWLFKKPKPSYENVIPNGEGWYRYEWGKWRKWDKNGNYDGSGKYLTNALLDDFAMDALKELLNDTT